MRKRTSKIQCDNQNLWNSIIPRKIIELLLIESTGKKVVRGTYPCPKNLKAAIEYVREAILKYPSSEMRELILSYLVNLKPPEKFVFQMTFLAATRADEPRHFQIMTDKETSEIIQVFSLLGHSDSFILDRIRDIPYGPSGQISIQDIRKYRYFFWNTATINGWSHVSQDSFKTYLMKNKKRAAAFNTTLHYGFGGASRDEVILKFKLPKTPDQIYQSIQQTSQLAQQRLQESLEVGDYKAGAAYSQIFSRQMKYTRIGDNNSQKGGEEDDTLVAKQILKKETQVYGIGGRE